MKAIRSMAHSRLETYTPRIIALGLLGVFLLFALTGCQGGRRTTAELPPVGDYALVSVDDKPVPCKLTHEGTAVIVKSGGLTFNADGACRSLSVFAVPPNQDVQREVKATCARAGAELTLRWQHAGVTKGLLSENDRKFMMNNEGMIFAYRRQAE
ncbi:MAG: hypothetical protein P4N60_13835 [Verrucomicrobiae bacterium]|nr:hypothetical protein [Verrucomicrobiae bacterium]